MAGWEKEEIEIADGTKVLAQMPVIVSASRSTDIPAFYADWFIARLKAGYVKWFNPFNGVPLYVGFRKTRLAVFWSKNPAPMLAHLDELDRYVEPDMFANPSGGWVLDEYRKDAGQRKACGCIMSKDIGEYNTCPHLCHYCYANTNNATAEANWNRHKTSPHTATIAGR